MINYFPMWSTLDIYLIKLKHANENQSRNIKITYELNDIGLL